MKHRCASFFFIVAALVLVSSLAIAQAPVSAVSEANPVMAQIPVFGPETFIRDTGEPQSITQTFSIQNPGAEFTLVVQNGEGKRGRVTSAVVELNGVVVVGPNAFNKQVDMITMAVSLQLENELVVEVRSKPGSSIIVTVLGEAPPAPSPVTGVTVAPDGFPVNTSTEVQFTAAVPYAVGGPVPLVELVQVSPSGDIIGIEGQMVDDGNLSLGDEIEGDGIFSFRKAYSFPQPSTMFLKVRANIEGQARYSEAFSLFAFTPITDQEASEMTNAQASAQQLLEQLVQTQGTEEALAATLAYLQTLPIVQQASITEGAVSIWIEYTNGMEGVVFYNPPGTKGTPLSFSMPQTASSSQLNGVINVINPGDIEVGNKRVLVLAPMLGDFGADDDGPATQSLYQNHNATSGCPSYDIVYLTDTQAGVGSFKALGTYGIVHISSHGTVANGQVLVLTGTPVTTQTLQTYQADLNANPARLVQSGGYLAVTPEFFRWYIVSMPSSLVFMSSCHSTHNNTMWNALQTKGAKAYLGYSDAVPVSFALQKAKYFHKSWVEDPGALVTTGEIFNNGCSDGACWNLLGANNLEAPSAIGLQDGGFEAADLGAWIPKGDGRVVTQLGGTFAPTEGARMGLISTGLGFTVNAGSLEQKACIAANATRLNFDWNFSSEEFQEWCGSIYQDYFRVDLIENNGATTMLFYRKVDDLCGVTSPVSFSFDQGDVHSTGWNSLSIDISPFAAANAGKSVTFRFAAGDVGDSIYDTAILLDNIRVITP